MTPEDGLADLAGRMQRLERDNRRLQLGAGGLAAVLVAVPLVAAVVPAQVPEIIDARSFVVLDEQGTVRAWLAEDGLTVFDEQGVGLNRVELNADRLGFYDEQGTLHIGLVTVEGVDGLNFHDEQGTLRIGLGVVEGVGGKLILYEDGEVIASLPR